MVKTVVEMCIPIPNGIDRITKYKFPRRECGAALYEDVFSGVYNPENSTCKQITLQHNQNTEICGFNF